MARKINTRPLRQLPICVVGAGDTEWYYLQHLKRVKGWNYKLRPGLFAGEAMSKILQHIERGIEDGMEVLCFFDEDVTQWNLKEKERLEALRQQYGKHEKVTLCSSMPSIEYWFLLHFADMHRLFRTSDEVIRELKNYMPAFDKSKKFLQNKKWVEDMVQGAQMDEAIRRGKQSVARKEQDNMDCSYTHVWKGMERLGQ